MHISEILENDETRVTFDSEDEKKEVIRILESKGFEEEINTGAIGAPKTSIDVYSDYIFVLRSYNHNISQTITASQFINANK
jgi:aspartate carbamoyltransferase regulatory subunit